MAVVVLAVTASPSRARSRDGNPGAAVTLSSVDAHTLATGGITLTQPTGSPSISADTAIQVAREQLPLKNVIETKLVHLDVSGMPGSPWLSWVVSVMPEGGVLQQEGPAVGPNVPHMKGTYCLVFVDATTGKFLFSESGGPAK